MSFKKFLNIKKTAQVASCLALLTLFSGKVMGQSYGSLIISNGNNNAPQQPVTVNNNAILCGTLTVDFFNNRSSAYGSIIHPLMTAADVVGSISFDGIVSNVPSGRLRSIVTGDNTMTVIFEPLATSYTVTQNDSDRYATNNPEVDGRFVTVDQYCNFLNSVARVDTYGLFADAMREDTGSNDGPYIIRSGTPDHQTYAPVDGKRGEPMIGATMLDMFRYCNWMQNGQPTGAQGPETTEAGVYLITATDDGYFINIGDGDYYLQVGDENFSSQQPDQSPSGSTASSAASN